MRDLVISAAVVLFLDQLTKRMVQLQPAGRRVGLGPILIRQVRSAKRIYGQSSARGVLVVVWLAALGSAIILYRSGAAIQSRTALIGVGAAVGGAAGNLLDILRRRCVIDFIDLRWWPVFNLADIAILGGLVMALWHQG